jgi:hypothetical protein
MSFLGNRPDSFQYGSTAYDHFSGDGVTTTFNLSRQVSANGDIQVVVNNVIQDPGVAYSVSNLTTLTFTGAPTAGTNNIYVVYRQFVQSGIAPGANTVTMSAIAANTIQPWQLSNSLLNPLVSTFTGDGSTVAFTLTQAAVSSNSCYVTVDGITQGSPANYSTNGATLTFTSAPAANSTIRVVQNSVVGTSIVPVDGSVTNTKLASNLTLKGNTSFGTNITVPGLGYFGANTGLTLANPLSVFTGNTNGYVQVQTQNQSNGTTASTDFVVTNNLGTDTTYYGDFGINSSNFSGTGSLSLPNATYLYAQNGDLALGTASANSIHFVVNNGSSDAMTILSNGNVGVGTNNPTSTLYVNGSINTTGYSQFNYVPYMYVPKTGAGFPTGLVGGPASQSANNISVLRVSDYLTIQHTSFTNVPVIGFNAQLMSSDYIGSGTGTASSFNRFSPTYAAGSYGIISSVNGGVAFNTGNWGGATSIDLSYFSNHSSYAGGVGNNGIWNFPNGLTFTNSSALTNSTLNDYETGTWTPKCGDASTNVSSVNKATYTKIGNRVFIDLDITMNNPNPGTTNYITNLPFYGSASAGNGGGGVAYTDFTGSLGFHVTSSTTVMYGWNNYNNSAANLSGHRIIIGFEYQTNF